MITGVAAQPIAAQNVNIDDLQQVQQDIDRVAADISALRSRDSARASTLRPQLDQLRKDVAYLEDKLQHGDDVTDREYDDVQNRLDVIRRLARGDARAAEPSTVVLPVGTEFDVRLQNALSSARAHVNERVDATTLGDVRAHEPALLPAGSVARGIVSTVTKATRAGRAGALMVAFNRITIAGRSYRIHATVERALTSTGAATKTEIAGVLIGDNGTLVATEGKDVDLRAGTLLRLSLDEPLEIAQPLN